MIAVERFIAVDEAHALLCWTCAATWRAPAAPAHEDGGCSHRVRAPTRLLGTNTPALRHAGAAARDETPCRWTMQYIMTAAIALYWAETAWCHEDGGCRHAAAVLIDVKIMQRKSCSGSRRIWGGAVALAGGELHAPAGAAVASLDCARVKGNKSKAAHVRHGRCWAPSKLKLQRSC